MTEKAQWSYLGENGMGSLIEDDKWKKIIQVVHAGQRSMRHCSIASVGVDGPSVTPIGTLFLRDDRTGFYFDQYASGLAANIESNPNVCVMAVNTSAVFWLRSFLKGEFSRPPGVRIYGIASTLRAASANELALVRKRVNPMQRLKGGKLIWSNFEYVRDISFTKFRPVSYPVMMGNVWE